jgi:hypothetical protein
VDLLLGGAFTPDGAAAAPAAAAFTAAEPPPLPPSPLAPPLLVPRVVSTAAGAYTCLVCQCALVGGQAAAIAHATATGHTNFGPAE